MKANRRSIPLAAIAVLSLVLSACVGPAQTPVAAPPPARASSLPIARAPAPADWHDAPATAGLWRWSREGGASVARFSNPPEVALFSLTCNAPAGTIVLVRHGTSGAASSLSILTTGLSRTLVTRAGGTATLSARDPLLDAMAFSRGRFAVVVPGLPTLYLPSWAEVGRVVEDCR